MSSLRVSILIPCHNHGAFLKQAVESALAQTFAPIDVTVIDDGSTDDSSTVARSFGDRITLISHENKGVVRSVNEVVPHLAGDLFLRLDSDNWLEPSCVEELHAALVSRPDGAFAYSDLRLHGGRAGIEKSQAYSLPRLIAGNYIDACALMRREDFLAAGGYSESLADVGYEDWDLWLKLAERRKVGVHVARPLVNYRVRDDSRNRIAESRMRETVRAVGQGHPGLWRRRSRRMYLLLALIDTPLRLTATPGGVDRWLRIMGA